MEKDPNEKFKFGEKKPIGTGMQLINRYLEINFEYDNHAKMKVFEMEIQKTLNMVFHNPYNLNDITQTKNLQRYIIFENFIKKFALIRPDTKQIDSGSSSSDDMEGGEYTERTWKEEVIEEISRVNNATFQTIQRQNVRTSFTISVSSDGIEDNQMEK
jgi:hypothetical protein